jgi:hypothetical protein
MRYILVDTQVNAGTPNRVSLHVLTRNGWAPWSEVDGKTNCTDPSVCPLLSFGTRFGAWKESLKSGGQVVPVDTEKVVVAAV